MTISLTGDAEAVARAEGVAAAMVTMVREGKSVGADDVLRLSLIERPADAPGATNGSLVLPGARRGVQPKTPGQAEYLAKIAEHDIVIGIGPAGTGKTYLAVAAAVDALMRKRVRRIVLARPAVEAGENLGFLPGDMQAKVDPYLRPCTTRSTTSFRSSAFRSSSKRAPSKWRRSPSCVAAPSAIRLSFSTKRRMPPACR